jgi:hypothetical protein
MKNYWSIKPIKLQKKPLGTFKVPNFTTLKPVETFSLTPKKINTPQNVKKKDMSYAQAKRAFPRLSPFGDYDKDFRVNMYDCRPFNPLMHKVPEGYEDRVVPSYARPNVTWKALWEEAERKLPHIFTTGDSVEEENSLKLKDALLKREETLKKFKESQGGKDLPFKDLVGIYRCGTVEVDRVQTQLTQHLLLKFLKTCHPTKNFSFDYDDEPKIVTVTDYATGETSRANVSQYLPQKNQTPPHIQNLLTLFSPTTNVTIQITDYPIDILQKSTVVSTAEKKGRGVKYGVEDLDWKSCETKGREQLGLAGFDASGGCECDIEFNNAIAWFYLGDKQPGKDFPQGRVMLRWGTTTGDWKGTPDVGIEFFPGSKEISREDYPHWAFDPDKKRGFYGINPSVTGALIGELQQVLWDKGYNSHVISAPYTYTGFCDTVYGHHVTPWYKKIPKQKAEKSRLDIKDTYKEILERPKMPSGFQYHFLNSKVGEDRWNIASRREARPDIVSMLSTDYSENVRRRVVDRSPSWGPLPPRAQKQFLKDNSDDIRYRYGIREDTSEEHKIEVIKTTPQFAVACAEWNQTNYYTSLKCTPKIREALIHSKFPEVQRAMTKRDDLNNDEINILAQSEQKLTRADLVRSYHDKMEDTTFKVLASDTDAEVREAVASSKTIEKYPELLEELARSGDELTQKAILLNHSNIKSNIYEILVGRGNKDVISLVMESPDIPDALFKKILSGIPADALDKVRLLDTMSRPSSKIKRRLIARRYLTDPQLISSVGLESIARDWTDDPIILKEVIKYLEDNQSNENSTLGIMDNLALSNNLPEHMRNDVFAYLIANGDEGVKKNLLRNNTVPEIIKSTLKEGLY